MKGKPSRLEKLLNYRRKSHESGRINNEFFGGKIVLKYLTNRFIRDKKEREEREEKEREEKEISGVKERKIRIKK